MKHLLKLFLPLSAAILAGCATPRNIDTFPKGALPPAGKGFEGGSYLPASQFLAPDLLRSPLHEVSPKVYNDGFANTFIIKTPEFTHIVTGTDNTAERIHEIRATQQLRKKTTIEAVGTALGERGENLVATPFRFVNGAAGRIGAARGPGEALIALPAGGAQVVGQLAEGVRQMGVTGARITSSAAGTKCSGFGNCITKGGRDIWSGINSIIGKHEAARRAHMSVDTDPYSRNPILQKEVDRIAYAEAWTGTAFKFGAANAGIPTASDYITGVGYYNNAEFLAGYQDAETGRNQQRALLASWGTPPADIKALFANDAFTHTMRTYLISALSDINNVGYRAKLTSQAAAVDTRYVAEGKLDIYRHLALMDQSGTLGGYIENTDSVIAISKDGAMILPIAADYLTWTPQVARPLRAFAALAGPGKPYQLAELHILGQGSPLLRENAKRLGLIVYEKPRPDLIVAAARRSKN